MTNQVQDKPAEKGITINNILMTIVILGGGIFSTIIISIMTDLKVSVNKVQESISTMQITDGVTINEMKHFKKELEDCKSFHNEVRKRITYLENKK